MADGDKFIASRLNRLIVSLFRCHFVHEHRTRTSYSVRLDHLSITLSSGVIINSFCFLFCFAILSMFDPVRNIPTHIHRLKVYFWQFNWSMDAHMIRIAEMNGLRYWNSSASIGLSAIESQSKWKLFLDFCRIEHTHTIRWQVRDASFVVILFSGFFVCLFLFGADRNELHLKYKHVRMQVMLRE